MSVWIETDLEPDDCLALYINPLASRQQYYVVGEGNSNIKYNRMKRYAQLLGLKDPIIIEGAGSKEDFPLDGTEFETLGKETCHQNYLYHFIKFANTENPIMFSLKPMKELLGEYSRNKKIMTILLSKIELYVYGGFNFRCVLKQEELLLELLGSFKKVVIYESYHVSGGAISVNRENFPSLEILLQGDEYVDTLRRFIPIWNRHLVNRLKARLEGDAREDQRKRNLEVIASIEGYEDFQMVLADFALMAIYGKVQPIPVKNFRFEGSYTKFDLADESNMYVYRNVSFDLIKSLIEAALQ